MRKRQDKEHVQNYGLAHAVADIVCTTEREMKESKKSFFSVKVAACCVVFCQVVCVFPDFTNSAFGDNDLTQSPALLAVA